MSPIATREALDRLARPLRRASGAGWVTLAVGGAALVLGAAAWLVRLGWVGTPAWVLAAWGLVLIGLVGIATVARRGHAQLRTASVARALERPGLWRAGALSSMLDASAGGTSAELWIAADRAHASELDRRGADALRPMAHAMRARIGAAAALLILGLAAFTSAGPVHGPAALLWHPGRAWEAMMAPVGLRASAAVVDRGGQVDLELRAIGRRSAILWLRKPGEEWGARRVPLDSTGHAVIRTGPLSADLFARVTSGRRSSDTVQVRVRLPVFLGTVALTAHYPGYLGLEDEPLPANGDTLVLPAGTRLDTRGEATAPLARAEWESAETLVPLDVRGNGFRGSFTPVASGTYRLALATASGAALSGDTVRVPMRLVADSAPIVDLPVPGADTTAPVNLRVPLVVDARDDHGLASVVVESRRISRLGFTDSAVRETVPLPPGRVDRAILNFALDLNRRGLVPGDTVRYFARAVDNAPAGHAGRSREYVLRLPTMSEARTLERRQLASVSARIDSIVARSRGTERQADDLARAHARDANDPVARADESLKFEDAKKVESVAQSQQQLQQQAEALQRSIQELKESAKAAGLGDSSWQRRLDEIRDQIDRALSPELKRRLSELQQALKDLDGQRTQEALQQLADAQKELRDALERSKELFRRAALEGDLANLSQESKELTREQQQWNEAQPAADSSRAAAEEKVLAARADSLSAALGRTAQAAAQDGRQPPMQRAAQQAAQAAQQMQQAGKSVQRGQREHAAEQGQQARKSLEPIGEELDQQRKEIGQEWRQEVSSALDRALQDASRLTERQLGVEEDFKRGAPPADTRAKQAAVEEGVQKLLDQMKATAGKNALVSPQIGVALALAQRQMQQARDAVSNANPNQQEGAERAGGAVDAMNAAAQQLVRARGDVSGAGSGSGLAEALEKMGQMASQQGQIGQQAGGLLPAAGGGGAQEQLQRLGAQQRSLAEQLERMRGQGTLPGAGEMANEAKELARKLEAGRLDRRTVERQERLFRRMLDAGRTLQGQEEDEKKERQATTARDDSAHVPPALRQQLDDEAHRLRMPSWEELQPLSPAERRLVVDYFRRLAERTAP